LFERSVRFHVTYGFGSNFEAMSSRLVKGALVYVQGQLTTHEYDRTIKVPAGKKVIEHAIKQLVVELKADTIRILDRPANTDHDAVEPEPTEAP